MINRLTTIGDAIRLSTIGPISTNNPKDTNKTVLVGTVAFVVFSAGAYYRLCANSRNLAPKMIEKADEQERVTIKLSNLQKEQNLEWGLPLSVKKTLDKLFEGSCYHSIDALPLFPVRPDDEVIKRESMAAPIMKGTIHGHRFIAIKVDTELSDEYIEGDFSLTMGCLFEKDRRVKEIFFLYQSNKDEPGIQTKIEALAWDEGKGGGIIHQPHFFTKSFTYSHNGSGPVEGQEDNFERVKALIKNGVIEDLKGLTWKIPAK